MFASIISNSNHKFYDFIQFKLLKIKFFLPIIWLKIQYYYPSKVRTGQNWNEVRFSVFLCYNMIVHSQKLLKKFRISQF